jgi:hypothetical protein
MTAARGAAFLAIVSAFAVVCLAQPLPAPGRVETLHSVSALAPEIAGRFREALDFQQIPSGQYFVFDRRGHSVHGVDAAGQSSWRLVAIVAAASRCLGAPRRASRSAA